MHPLFCEAHDKKKIRYVSHRGFTPLAPENSLPSFEYAGKLGQWAIETDVRISKDGVLMCCHDGSIDRMYDGTGNIDEMTEAEIYRFRINSGNRLECFENEMLKMPEFSQYLSICRKYGSVPFVEMKTEDAERVLWQIHKSGFEDDEVVMSACSLETLKAVNRLAPNMFIHWIFADESLLQDIAACPYAGISLMENDLLKPGLKERIQNAKKAGLKVCLRAGDNVEAVNKMMEFELDYIPTNCMHQLDGFVTGR